MRERDIGLILSALGLLAIVLRPRTASASAPVGTGTLGPLEIIGGTGNTNTRTPYPMHVPSAPTQGESGDLLCDCAPLASFGPACFGVTWEAFTVESGYQPPSGFTVRDLTPAQRNASALDSRYTWRGIDFRARRPVRCG